jgi:predicted dehydrogenase
MKSFDRFRVGIIGFGIGKIYATAFSSVRYYYSGLPQVDLVSIATAGEASGDLAVQQFGFQRKTTDYHDLLSDDDINTIVIASPNYLHHSMVMESLKAGKAVYVDKPLANSLQQAEEIYTLSKELNRDAQLIFEVRFCPALQYAYELIRSGRLGEIYSFRAHYYRPTYADPKKSLRWKGSAEKSGTGALGDLGSHLIDMVSWLLSPPQRVAARLRTVIPERIAADGSKVKVENDDHVVIQAELAGGQVGTIEAARLITGVTNDFQIEIYGQLGSLRWNMMDANNLYLADARMPEKERGWLQIPTLQRYPAAFLPGPDVPLGVVRFHIASVESFMRRTLEGGSYSPGIKEGTQVQAVIQSAVESDRLRAWVEVPQFE